MTVTAEMMARLSQGLGDYEKTFSSIEEFNAFGGARAYGKGPVWIGGQLYWSDGSKLTKHTQKRDQEALLPFTPTIYFDPSKSAKTSTGAGTEANPAYTAAQLQSLVPANATGVILGIKRGTVCKEGIKLTAASSRQDFPFMIIPYGDPNLPMPLIDVGVVQTGWTLEDAANNIWKKHLPVARNFFQVVDAATNTERRIVTLGNDTLANKLAKLKSVIDGYCFWDNSNGGTMYIKPHNGANPNSGVIVSDSGKTAINGGNPLYINLTNQAASGNVIIYGIACRHSPASNIAIIASSGSTSITSLGPVIVAGCDLRHNAFPINNTSGSNAFAGDEAPLSSGGGNCGISVYGFSDTVRCPIYARGNYIEDCGNNAVETMAVDSGYIEYNRTKDVYGFAWAELYSSTSNVTVQYNDAQYDNLLLRPTYNGARGMTVAEYGGGLFWAAGYDVAGNLTQATLAMSSGNICRYNTSYNCPSKSGGSTKCIQDAGTEGLVIEKNIIHLKMQYADGGACPISLTESIGVGGISNAPTTKVIFRNNIVYMDTNIQANCYPIPFPQIVPYATNPTAAIGEIDNNVYYIPQATLTDQIRYRKNNSISGGAGNNGVEVLALWKTALGAEANSRFINPMIGTDGQLLDFSPALHVVNQ